MYWSSFSPDRPIYQDSEVLPPGGRASGEGTGYILERTGAVVSRPADIGTPGRGGLWLERSAGRKSSSKARHAGNSALWAPRHDHVLAGHESPKAPQTRSKAAPDDVALSQAWQLLPEEIKDAFGNLFSRMAIRLLRRMATAKVEV